MHDGFEFMEAIRAFTEDVQQQVDFAGGLERHNKNANLDLLGVGASKGESFSARFKNLEAAAGNKRDHIAAAVTDKGVGGEHRVFDEARAVVVRINWLDRKVVRENRAIRRNRRGDYFPKSDAGAGQRAVEAANGPGRVGSVR